MTPTPEEAIRQCLEATGSNVHVAIPGTIVRYDASRGEVDVLPGVRRPYPSEDGGATYRDLPVIPSVPLMWPGGSLGGASWPVAVGDAALVVCADYDPSAWVAAGGVQTPEDSRIHSLAHGFAIPFRRGQGGPSVTTFEGVTGIKLGAGASDFVALAALVTAQLDDLKDAIKDAAVVANDGGAAFKANILTALTGWPRNVAASKVRAE